METFNRLSGWNDRTWIAIGLWWMGLICGAALEGWVRGAYSAGFVGVCFGVTLATVALFWLVIHPTWVGVLIDTVIELRRVAPLGDEPRWQIEEVAAFPPSADQRDTLRQLRRECGVNVGVNDVW